MAGQIAWKSLKLTEMIRIVAGFAILFLLYHGAEYMIMHQNSSAGFLVVQGLFFTAAWLIARWQGFDGLRAWGVVFTRNACRNLLVGLFAGFLVYGLYFYVSLRLYYQVVAVVPPVEQCIRLFLLFSFGTFFSSLSEDVLTRSYLYRHFSGKMRDSHLLLLSSCVYVANHIHRWGDGMQVLLYLFIIGIFLMMALMITKSISLTLGLHWSGNIVYQATHNILQTSSEASAGKQLWLYIGFLLLLIPITYFLAKRLPPEKDAI